MIQPVCINCRRAALLTCVSNGANIGGPGHSAVILDDYVYTFEASLGGWLSVTESGWFQVRTADYLKANTWRPIVIQELSETQVNATAIRGYISRSDDNDEDFISSGVCSQQAAKALSAGIGAAVDPWGMNIPYLVYRYIKNSGLVVNAYYTFPDVNGYHFYPKNTLHNLYWPECERRRDPPPVLSW